MTSLQIHVKFETLSNYWETIICSSHWIFFVKAFINFYHLYFSQNDHSNMFTSPVYFFQLALLCEEFFFSL